MEIFEPIIRLIKVDFPTLGPPTIVAIPALVLSIVFLVILN